jgi:hypothetical protein
MALNDRWGGVGEFTVVLKRVSRETLGWVIKSPKV